VTGRPRRCGWIDLPLLRYATAINGIDWLVVTKLDVLDTLDEVPVCVSYKSGGRKSADLIPASAAAFEKVECIYERVPGWKKSTQGIRDFTKLPRQAQDYMKYLENRTGARIGMVSTGPDRDQTIFMPDFVSAIKTSVKSAKKA
jgi:adenylosuccinate synthase